MKKKILVILAVICVIASGVGYYFYRTQRNVSVGLNNDIQDENGKKGKTSLDSSKVLVIYFSNGEILKNLQKKFTIKLVGILDKLNPKKLILKEINFMIIQKMNKKKMVDQN